MESGIIIRLNRGLRAFIPVKIDYRLAYDWTDYEQSELQMLSYCLL